MSSGTELSVHFTLGCGFQTMEAFLPAYNNSAIFASQFPSFAPREFCCLQNAGDLSSHSIQNDDEHHRDFEIIVNSERETMAFSKQFSNQMLIAGGRSSNHEGGDKHLYNCESSLHTQKHHASPVRF